MKNTYKLYFLLLLVVTLMSCRNESCQEDMEIQLNINFYKPNTTTTKAITYLTVHGTSIADSFLYKNKSSVSSIALPLDMYSDTSEFEFIIKLLTNTIVDSTREIDTIYPGTIPDTIWGDWVIEKTYIYDTDTEVVSFIYNRDPIMVSPECGFSYIINLDSIVSTKNTIDSIYITKPYVERASDEENVKIFF